MAGTIDKYNEYMITGFVKSIQPIVIDHARGSIVTDTEGHDYIDCFAGISVVNAGHCNPEIIEAAKAQMDKLVHACSYVYHVTPTADLAEKMAHITPGRLKKSFFANSGAEAIEGALKLARLYTGKHEVIALTMGFHGRTWGALSVTGNASRKRRGGPYAPGVSFAPAPYLFRSGETDPNVLVERTVRALEDVISYHTSGDVAAFLAEPVLGEGGIIVPPPTYFQAVQAVLDKHSILFIADEVQTGFGRTGKMFGIEHYGVEPDILVTAKGIAAGFPLGGFTTTGEIAAAFRPGDHLSTFGGNPISCAAAIANIDYIQRENLPDKAHRDGEYVMGRLQSLQSRFPAIGEVRGLGLMIGMEMVQPDGITPAPAQAEAIRASCLDKGVLIGVGGAFGNVVRFQPPLVITRAEIDRALEVLQDSLHEVLKDHRVRDAITMSS